MTDYTKHIETGNQWLSSRGDAIRAEMGDFVTAAIELMRAAAPKDAEAERVRCSNVAASFDFDARSTRRDRAEVLLSERAAARADGRALEQAEWLDLNLGGKLSAAQAAAKMWEVRATDLANRIDPRMQLPTTEERLREKLSAAQAEIARLRTQSEVRRERNIGCDALQTKLTNLRAAAERVLLDGDSERIGSWKNLYDAIEASR